MRAATRYFDVFSEVRCYSYEYSADKGDASYSWRNATIGSTRMARRVGT